MQTKAVYTICWGDHWEKYSQNWIEKVNLLDPAPDEIVVVSDKDIDISSIKLDNKKLIIVDSVVQKLNHALYRNTAVMNISCDWSISYDIDDDMMSDALDFPDSESNVYVFNYVEKLSKKEKIFLPGIDKPFSNRKRTGFTSKYEAAMCNIQGVAAVKTDVLKKYLYDPNTHEDKIMYARMDKYNDLLVASDDRIRFLYNNDTTYDGKHKSIEDHKRNSSIYYSMLKDEVFPLWTFWFGDINMPFNRKSSYSTLNKWSGCRVKLVTDRDYMKYEVPSEIKFHEGLNYLSNVHRSAYLRAYFMYMYGGVYCDLKPYKENFLSLKDSLYSSNFTFIGYCETDSSGICTEYWSENEDADLIASSNKDFKKFSGFGKFMFKPGSIFAYKWIMGIHKILDSKMENLIESGKPFHSYATSSGLHPSVKEAGGYRDVKYPIGWGEIGGNVFHKLQYENNFSINLNIMKKEAFSLEQYR